MLHFPGINFYTFKAHATDLPKKDMFGKSDPYLVIRMPIDIQGEKKIKGREKTLSKSFEVATTLGEIAIGITATTAVAIATGVVAVVFPIAFGALGAYAIKRATRLHPHKKDFNEIFVSEVIKKTLNPTWAEFRLGFHESFLGNQTAQVLVECYDWNRAQASKFIGFCWITLETLLKAKDELEFDLTDNKGRKAGKLFLSVSPVPKI
eukprot:Phypoly_transcript_16272.p1 GENE.Phypoly_transcript_16272~~Phypoly_transcript_16272.p1  ORF type:complete len:207 (+),score=22.16 Phypoly_transcript_16272:183-803(+)